MPVERSRLILDTVNGLGNRLRLLSSGAVLADHYGFSLAAAWADGSNQPERGHEFLFSSDSGIEFLDAVPADSLRLGAGAEPGLREGNLFNADGQARFLDCYTNCDLHVEGAVDLSPFAGRGDIAIRSIYAVKPAGMSDEEFCRRRTQFYRKSLHPSQLLLDRIKREEEGLGRSLSSMVGLHIRYGDALFDRQKITSRQVTHIRQFEEIIRSLLEQDDSRQFLLCTDTGFVRDRIAGSFPGSIRTPPGLLDRSLLQATAEMLLLSGTREIVGSRPSTFSYEAAFIGTRPITIFEDGRGWVKYHPLHPQKGEVVCESELPLLNDETYAADFSPLTVKEGFRLTGGGQRYTVVDDAGRYVAEISSSMAHVFRLCDGLRTGWDIIEMSIRAICKRKPELTDRFRKSLHSQTPF